MDVVLLGLPHKVSATKMPELMASGARVVDLSGDFRLRDAATYKRYYHADHPCADKLTDGTFVYGLPELIARRHQEGEVRRVAGLLRDDDRARAPSRSPSAGLLDGAVEVVGITGSSGSGVVPSAGTHHPVRAVNLRTYKPLDHQHIPEITQTLGDAGAKDLAIRFVPVSAPLSRGHLRDVLRARRREHDRRPDSCPLQGHVQERAVRPRPAEAPARGRRGERDELRRGRRPGRHRRRRAGQARRRLLLR